MLNSEDKGRRSSVKFRLPFMYLVKRKRAGNDGKEVLIFDSSKSPFQLYSCAM
jgi:hypothetical protein